MSLRSWKFSGMATGGSICCVYLAVVYYAGSYVSNVVQDSLILLSIGKHS